LSFAGGIPDRAVAVQAAGESTDFDHVRRFIALYAINQQRCGLNLGLPPSSNTRRRSDRRHFSAAS